ncbi:uncharacterized protein LOC108736458 [Agrilus planipennis]|uniref:Uncharacterized protein LOC108736458 n=1 Tax=Agrilus planipennis TaxID=224129 RepID=A0A1W4WKE2_AGRPL|nr:uncharacterized protein LOC108736458 [Agrilus planipennis]
MHFKLVTVLLFGAFMSVNCNLDFDSILNVGDINFTLSDEPAPEIPHSRNKRNVKNYLPAALSCALKYDTGCLIENAENYLEEKRLSVIAEADAAALQMRGRSDGESPSELASMIGNVISEMTNIFKDSFVGFFRDSKEADEDEEEEEEDDENDGLDQTAIDDNKKERQNLEEDRGKKKKQKLKAIIKLLILGVVLYAKAILLLKFLAWKVQVKFLLIALGNLLINGLKLWWEFKAKSSHNPQKVIYYEHAQHQHHYDGGGEDWESSGPPSGGGGGGYWGRSYDDKDMLAAQELAYAKQQRPKPADYLANAKKAGSWFAK